MLAIMDGFELEGKLENLMVMHQNVKLADIGSVWSLWCSQESKVVFHEV